MVLLAAVLSSHFLHRDKLRDLGLSWQGLEASARLVLPLALALYLPFLIYGFASHTLVVSLPGRRIAVMFANYALWCLFQQYMMQSYFHHRLEGLVSNPHRRSLLLALMFGAAHIPNPILMIATTLGGFIFAEVFARHRNIWPLALAQAVGGFLTGALSPPALIHNMRVGPGYFTYGLR
jgi:membrane protease YdiL (CAAX protease family)